MTIWKYSLLVTDWQEIELPEGAEILCVQVQNDEPCIWVQIPQQTTKVKPREFRIYGTGHFLMQDVAHEYIGTFQLQDGGFVGHLFETT